MKNVAAFVFCLVFLLMQRAMGAEEDAAFVDLQHLAEKSEVKAAFEKFKQDHPAPASKEDVEAFEKACVEGAMILLEKAKSFETRYPQSTHLGQVRAAVIDNLGMIFGVIGLPIPKARAGDVDGWVRKRLAEGSQDNRLYMVLVRLAGTLAQSQQETALGELSREKNPEPARSMAKDGLQTSRRVGHPLKLEFTALDGRKVNIAALKGKVVLIDFWSTTCGPCMREMPALKKLYSKYKIRGFEVIGITLDEDKEVLRRIID